MGVGGNYLIDPQQNSKTELCCGATKFWKILIFTVKSEMQFWGTVKGRGSVKNVGTWSESYW